MRQRPAPDLPWRPTREQLDAARGLTLRDVAVPRLEVLFCGINPSLYSAAVGHHFARPGNRFWKALHGAGFTPRLLDPFEDRRLLDHGLGVTNLVGRATASADELSPQELRRGAQQLRAKVRRLGPRFVAVVGVSAYRIAFDRPRASIGPQDESIASTRVWILPNPSGRTAAYQLPALVEAFGALRAAVNEAAGA